MSEAVASESAAASSPKKKNARRKSKSKPNHPKISQMVNTAIVELKDRGGSSLQAIKKYIASTYQVDVEKLAPFIKKHLKMSVSDGSLIQTKGKGASGSFKISVTGKKSEPKHVAKVKIVSKKVVSKPKPSRKVAKPKTKAAVRVKKVSKVKAKKVPVKAKAPKPKKAMKKGSKSSKKAPRQSKTV